MSAEDQAWLLDQLAREYAETGIDPAERAPGYAIAIRENPGAWAEAVARAGGSAAEDHGARTYAEDPEPDLEPDPEPTPPAEDLYRPTIAELRDRRDGLGRKFEAEDMTAGTILAAQALAEDYTGTFEFMVKMREAAQLYGRLTAGQAKGVCNAMTARKRSAPAAGTDEGIYYRDGVVIRVKKSAETGRLYTTVYNEATKSFDYDPRAIDGLGPEHKMTLEAAEEFGKRFGICAVCARILSDPASVERGIGPVCAKKF